MASSASKFCHTLATQLRLQPVRAWSRLAGCLAASCNLVRRTSPAALASSWSAIIFNSQSDGDHCVKSPWWPPGSRRAVCVLAEFNATKDKEGVGRSAFEAQARAIGRAAVLASSCLIQQAVKCAIDSTCVDYS